MVSSYLYKGSIKHARRLPKEHHFSYSVYYYFINLEDLEPSTKSSDIKKFIQKRFDRNKRYGKTNLNTEIRALVRTKSGINIDGPIYLLTQIQTMRLTFNPVSFYYCYDQKLNLKCIVAEVNNTPWNEQYCYCLPIKDNTDHIYCFDLDKKFHVSPFMSMNFKYRWSFNDPNENLIVVMHNHSDEGQAFTATLSLKRLPLSIPNLLYCKIKIPLMNYKVVFGIYWQALLLWLKGIPFVPHPKK
jgi:uncharacterized protein